MLDLVNPERAGRRSGYLRWKARFDEAGGTLQDHGRDRAAKLQVQPASPTSMSHGSRTNDRTRRGATAEAAWAQTEIGPEKAAVMPRAVVGRRSQSFQTPGKSGGGAGTAALTSTRAACKAASLVWSR